MGVCSSASLLPTPAHEADNPKETAGPAAGQSGHLAIWTMRRSRDLDNAEISGSGQCGDLEIWTMRRSRDLDNAEISGSGQCGDLGIWTMRRSRDLDNAEISGSDGPRPIPRLWYSILQTQDSRLQTHDSRLKSQASSLRPQASGLQTPASSLWTQDPGLQTRAHLSFLQGEEFWPPPTSRRWSRDSAPVSVFSVPAPPPTLGRWSDDCSSRGNPIHPVGGRREHIRNHRETSKSSITAPPV